MKIKLLISWMIFLNFTVNSCDNQNNNLNEPNNNRINLSDIKLPPGFKIEVYAENVSGARSMEYSEEGILFVGSRGAGNVYALVDEDGDMKSDKKYMVAEGLNSPNGVALKDGDLYVAEVSRVIKFSDIISSYKNSPDYEVINDSFPSDRHHGWKYIAFGPDDKLYVPVGAPCNICLSEEKIYASITRMNADGTDREIFAEGIRNTVGFDWHPETSVLWFTDNGRDMMGDDIPPDELNRAPQKGMHFGYPFCHGENIQDPEYNSRSCDEFVAPVQNLGPHVAALGMKFYTGDMFPAEYKNQIFIPEHGSWNRTNKIGYRITLVRLKGNDSEGYEVFADGWLQGEDVSGRPVDLEILPDGSMLVSDDFAYAIYRIYYEE